MSSENASLRPALQGADTKAEPSADWKPIKSAPRDGSWFYAKCPEAERLVRFADNFDRFPTNGDGKLWPTEPTHWRSKSPEEALADAHEALAQWMLRNSYATGHGDTIEGLIAELDWQHAARREPIAGEEFLEFKEALSDLRSLRQEHRDLTGGGPGWNTRWEAAWAKVDELYADEDEAAWERAQEDRG